MGVPQGQDPNPEYQTQATTPLPITTTKGEPPAMRSTADRAGTGTSGALELQQQHHTILHQTNSSPIKLQKAIIKHLFVGSRAHRALLWSSLKACLWYPHHRRC